ncbi:hypothetical protein LC087_01420 [Bacillus carboniphilus]|uniref:Uncharacterized protein n=1 Tax=Bacillus carboniphilus TaxID=86663 RepID=A0ABY9JZA1_9BACI|nr:hypothetical protein [Bacillus carboniphilus]WLR42920.1 hypothetical protein LC087_01420 [Bacillus carboniphilus]
MKILRAFFAAVAVYYVISFVYLLIAEQRLAIWYSLYSLALAYCSFLVHKKIKAREDNG